MCIFSSARCPPARNLHSIYYSNTDALTLAHTAHPHTQTTCTDTSTCSPSACTTRQGFRPGWWILWAESIYLLKRQPPSPSPSPPPLLVLLQYGLSTSLLSMRQRYQAKNVSGVDSRHAGTAASTSASEPAGWGIRSSGQVNTAALWSATVSYNKSVWEKERETLWKSKPYIGVQIYAKQVRYILLY